MRTTTRRGFLAGAVASVAVPAAPARSATGAGSIRAEREIVLRGRALAAAADGSRLVVAHDRRRTVGIVTPGREGRRVVEVGGQPIAVAVSRDGRLAAAVTAAWDQPGIALVDLDAGALLRRIDAGAAPYGIAFAGDRLVSTGGEGAGRVRVLDGDGSVVADVPVGALPRDVAITGDGQAAWVALAGEDRVACVDLGRARVARTLATPPLPERVAVSPDGRRLLVAHGGLDRAHVSEIEVASGRVTRHEAGRLPSAVAWSDAGRRLVALGGAGAVLVLAPGTRPVRHAAGAAPRGLAVAGRRAWTVDALTGAVSQVRL